MILMKNISSLLTKKKPNEFEKTKLMAFKDLMQQRDLFKK